jgi:hypothetical protein
MPPNAANMVGYLRNSTYIRGVGFAYAGNNNFIKAVVKDTNVSSYVTDKTITSETVIVPFADLAIDTTGVGYFELNASSQTYKKNGITIYDNNNNTNGNVLGILTGGTEFELEDPQEFWRQYNQTDNFFVALKREKDTERKRYLHFKKRPSTIAGQDIEVLIKRREKYKSNADDPNDPVVICDGSPPGGYELMDHDTLLGKSVEQIAVYKEHYDLVLFFNKDKTNFFNTQALDGYRIPAGIKLYAKATPANNIIRFHDVPDRTEEMIVLDDGTVNENETGSNRTFRGFFYKGNRRYMLTTDISGYRDKILNWDENFINVGNANNNNSRLMGEIFELVKEYFRSRNKTERGVEKEWNFRTIYKEPSIVKQLKRKLVCRHPLEWDRDLYIDGGQAPFWLKPGWAGRQFMEKVEATDIWSGLRGRTIEGLNLTANDFIFAHPVYFANYLNQEGLLAGQRIRKLKIVQDETVALPCLQPKDGRGMYGIHHFNDTYCNHAAYITINAVDENYLLFICNPDLYRRDDPPWLGIDDISKSIITESFRQSLSNYNIRPNENNLDTNNKYNYKDSNIWCDILNEQERLGVLKRLNGQQIQDYANMGYVVIGAWKNRPISVSPGNYSPHYATVRPGFKFYTLSRMMLANVGGTNGIKNVNGGFLNIEPSEIRWYYNPNQKFQGQINRVINNYLKLR